MLSILMPVYNEKPTAEKAIEQVLSTDLPMDFELVITDDGSDDGTSELLDQGDWGKKVRIFHHDVNQGKGAAVRTAIGEAKGEICAIFDADLEYEPSDLGPLLIPLIEGKTNAAFGFRAFTGYSSHSFLFVIGNKFVTLVANILFNSFIRDLMTCHKVVRTDVLRGLDLRENGFTIEPEITARLLQHGERIFEVPVSYRARSNEEGKHLTWVDGFRVLWTLLRCRFSSA